jgi:phosphoribosylpyrophosphate synthetase
VLHGSELDHIVVLDTVARAKELEGALSPRLSVVPCAPLLAGAIRALHQDGSIVALQS